MAVDPDPAGATAPAAGRPARLVRSGLAGRRIAAAPVAAGRRVLRIGSSRRRACIRASILALVAEATLPAAAAVRREASFDDDRRRLEEQRATRAPAAGLLPVGAAEDSASARHADRPLLGDGKHATGDELDRGAASAPPRRLLAGAAGRAGEERLEQRRPVECGSAVGGAVLRG